MLKQPLTRRGFIEGAALAACTTALTAGATVQAFAEGGEIGSDARPSWNTAHAICQACPNACGYTAYTVDGKLERTIGDHSSPQAAGRLCSRGYGYTQSAFSSADLKNPMRKKENGTFETITWDEALNEIALRLAEIAAFEGTDSLAIIYNGITPSAKLYSNLFANLIGCPNVFVDDATYDVVKAIAYEQTIGADSYIADIENAELVVLVDTSMTDVATPDLIAALQKARSQGKKVISIDPRLGMLGSFADEWYPVNPGTELALLLAVSNWLIANDSYDSNFITENVSDFDAWAEAISTYTPSWAEEVTGLQSYRIEQLAAYMAESAPKVAIQYGNGRIAGVSYSNSGETARTVCLLNALLGAWQATGGALLPFDYDVYFESVGIDAVAGATNVIQDYSVVSNPLGKTAMSGASDALSLVVRNKIKGLISIDADIAYDYENISGLNEALDEMGLFVCIAQQMTETAELADYILPVCSYLECSTFPQFLEGTHPVVAMSSQVISPVDGDNAKPLSLIMDGLTIACNIFGSPTAMITEGLVQQLDALGLSAKGLEQCGSVELANIASTTGWNTDSGKIQCVNEAYADAGLSAMPIWVPLKGVSNLTELQSNDMNFGQSDEMVAVLEDDEGEGVTAENLTLNLITGEQPVIGSRGYNTAELMDIATMYDLNNVWVNKDIAELIGIESDDTVGIGNDNGFCTAKAYVTERIAPTAVYLPSGFGHGSSRQNVSKDIGTNALILSEPSVIEGYGAICTQDATVTLMPMKEGA